MFWLWSAEAVHCCLKPWEARARKSCVQGVVRVWLELLCSGSRVPIMRTRPGIGVFLLLLPC